MPGPYSVIWAYNSALHAAGPFDSREKAVGYVGKHRRQGNSKIYQFDLDEEMVYIFGPDHRVEEMCNDDFDEQED